MTEAEQITALTRLAGMLTRRVDKLEAAENERTRREAVAVEMSGQSDLNGDMIRRDLLLLHHITEAVAISHGVTLSDIMGRCKEKRIVWPRKCAYKRCRDVTKFSLPVLAHFFDRDHATILHGIRSVEQSSKTSRKKLTPGQ
jgi:chromosomal replication initiation ATPase DnaA